MFGRHKSYGIRVSAAIRRLIDAADQARDLGDLEAAISSYQRVVDAKPKLHHIWVQLGNCAGEADNIELALSAYSRATDIHPDDIEPLLFSARLYDRLCDTSFATQYYRRVLALVPNHEEAKSAILKGPIISHTRKPPVFSPITKKDRQPRLPEGVSLADMQSKLDTFYFHHGINFGDGLVSKSGIDIETFEQTAEAFFGAINLHRHSMLDVGAWSGGYSFEAKWRGAKKVVATDHYVWTHSGFRGRDAFNLARAITGLDIEARQIDVPDINAVNTGIYDVVLFSGVFYHLIDPVSLTKQVAECARHLFIVETHLDAFDFDRPAMVFYPGQTLNDDVTNWWGPNPQCVCDILRESGFDRVWYCDAPGTNNRGVFHAFRNHGSENEMKWNPDSRWYDLSDPSSRALIFGQKKSVV